MTWYPHAELAASKGRTVIEIVCVLLVSLGASAIWSVLNIIDRATQEVAIGDQTVALNAAQSDRSWLDFLYQLTGHVLDFAPVLLVCWLLWRSSRPHLGRLGLTFERPGRDSLWGAGLVLAIGIPGLAIYALGRELGLTVGVQPSPLDAQWFTVPMLLLAAIKAGVTEEVIVVGYLFERLRSLGWGRWSIICAAAVLRGTYHLYQGYGAFVGNVLMGLLFGYLYTRFGRLLPLVIAHILIDAVVFLGYPFVATLFPAFFGL